MLCPYLRKDRSGQKADQELRANLWATLWIRFYFPKDEQQLQLEAHFLFAAVEEGSLD